MEIIELKDINKYYYMGENTLHVLKDISLTVEKGDYLAILGPSGSGKSTLMNVIGCMDVADSGEYFLDGESVHDAEEEDFTRIRNEKIGLPLQGHWWDSQRFCWQMSQRVRWTKIVVRRY